MEIDNGQVLGFAVNYRAQIQGEWVEVVRYDTNHGYLHIHENWKDPETAIRPLEDKENADPPYNETFTKAQEDLKANWRDYRRRMEQRLMTDG